jgi:hypothetical protein
MLSSRRSSKGLVASFGKGWAACGDVAVARTTGVLRHPEGVERSTAEMKPKPDLLACSGGQSGQFVGRRGRDVAVVVHLHEFAQSVGGPRASDTGGGSSGSPRCVRILRMGLGSVMKAISRMSPPHAGHSSGNSSPTRTAGHQRRSIQARPGRQAVGRPAPPSCGSSNSLPRRCSPVRPRCRRPRTGRTDHVHADARAGDQGCCRPV